MKMETKALVIKEPEIKVPVIKEPEIKELVIKEPETKALVIKKLAVTPEEIPKGIRKPQ